MIIILSFFLISIFFPSPILILRKNSKPEITPLVFSPSIPDIFGSEAPVATIKASNSSARFKNLFLSTT